MIIGKGPRRERETIINFNEAEDTMHIWTASEVVYRRLCKAGFHPATESDRSASFQVPKLLYRFPKQPSEARRRAGLALAEARKAKLLGDLEKPLPPVDAVPTSRKHA